MIYKDKLIFKSLDEVQEYLGVTATFDFQILEKYIRNFQNELAIPLIGKTLFTSLVNQYNDDETSLDDLQKELIHYLRFPIVGFSFQSAMPELMTEVSSSGIRIKVNENYKTAFQWQTDLLGDSVRRSAHAATEQVIEFLHANIISFPDYQDSEAFKNNTRYFINTVKEFDRFRNIRGLRDIYLAMTYLMEKEEYFTIRNTTGQALFDDLKKYVREQAYQVSDFDDTGIVQIEDGQMSVVYSGSGSEENPHYKNLLWIIRNTVANLAFSKATNELNLVYDEKGFLKFNTNNTQSVRAFQPAAEVQIINLADGANEIGQQFLSELTSYLYKNADELPLFKNSDAYKPESNNYVKNKKYWGFHTALAV